MLYCGSLALPQYSTDFAPGNQGGRSQRACKEPPTNYHGSKNSELQYLLLKLSLAYTENNAIHGKINYIYTKENTSRKITFDMFVNLSS